MILGKEDDKCTGCGACASTCIKHCIVMKKDDEGFYYPEIDNNECINCNMCSNVCHLNTRTYKCTKINRYAGYSKDQEIRNEGSSGGLFGLIANYIKENGGIVYGATFSEDYRSLVHDSTKNIEMRRLLKSKYLESYLGNTFLKIKEDLEQDNIVLFCGTPCQVRGLINYLNVLNISYNKLICVDFLCHGVPSVDAYMSYLEYLEKKYKSKVQSVSFRSKKLGWETYCMYIEFKNGKHYLKTGISDPYYRFFFECTGFRKSCYRCRYVENSVADITLGDFWKERYDCSDKGVSYVSTNTFKGDNLINSLKDKIDWIQVKESEVNHLYSGHDYNGRIGSCYDFSFYKSSIIREVKDLILKNRLGRYLVKLKRG